jgi:hypothetical protein
MAVITIVRQNVTIGFDPPTLTINQGDVVVFRNEDPLQSHLITKRGQGPYFWFQNPMAPFVPGQPADTSDEVFFAITKDPAPPMTVTYVSTAWGPGTKPIYGEGTIVVVDPRPPKQ